MNCTTEFFFLFQRNQLLNFKAFLIHSETQKRFFSTSSCERRRFFQLHDTKSNTRLKCDFRVLLNIICWIVSFVNYVIILREWARESSEIRTRWVPQRRLPKIPSNIQQVVFCFIFVVSKKSQICVIILSFSERSRDFVSYPLSTVLARALFWKLSAGDFLFSVFWCWGKSWSEPTPK